MPSSTWTPTNPPSTSAISRSLTFSHPKSLHHGHSHARPQSLPLSHSQDARSRVCSLFLSKSASISTVIPEGDQTEIDNDSDIDTGAPDSDLSSDTRELEEEQDSARLMIGGEEALVSASDAQQFFGNNLEDASKNVDWREFCLEILDG